MKKYIIILIITVSYSFLKDGQNIEYYDNGNIKAKFNSINGKLQGKIIVYYDNGNIKAKSNFLNGKLQGKIIVYYKIATLSRNLIF